MNSMRRIKTTTIPSFFLPSPLLGLRLHAFCKREREREIERNRERIFFSRLGSLFLSFLSSSSPKGKTDGSWVSDESTKTKKKQKKTRAGEEGEKKLYSSQTKALVQEKHVFFSFHAISVSWHVGSNHVHEQ